MPPRRNANVNDNDDRVEDESTSAEASGALQDRLTYCLNVLTRLLTEEAPPAFVHDDDLSNEENLIEAEGIGKTISNLLEELNTYRELVHDDLEEWCSLMKKLPNDERAAEAQAYKDFKTLNEVTDNMTNVANKIFGLNKKQNEVEKQQKRLQRIIGQGAPPPIAGGALVAAAPVVIKHRELPPQEFDGEKIEEWTEFYQAFMGNYDNDVSLSTVDKFRYLKSFLKGEAADLLLGVQVDDMHYPIALRILEDEYGNQNRLVERLNDRLLSLKPITKSGELKPLVRTFEKCCKLLEAKHVDVQNNSLLRQDFVKKLPKRVIAKVYEAEAKSATWDTNDLRKMLANVVQLETRVDETYSQSHSEKKPQGKKPQQAYSTVEVGKQTPANSKEKPTRGNCKFCSKDQNLLL